MIRITPSISIDKSDIHEDFIRASGPGGQNVNRVATAVQLRFDVAGCSKLPDEVRKRLVHLAGRRMTKDGILVIEARRFRTQERNRADALERLIALLRKAAEPPRLRRKSAPPPGSQRARLEDKRHRSATKRLRRSVSPAQE